VPKWEVFLKVYVVAIQELLGLQEIAKVPRSGILWNKLSHSKKHFFNSPLRFIPLSRSCGKSGERILYELIFYVFKENQSAGFWGQNICTTIDFAQRALKKYDFCCLSEVMDLIFV
jgi:hypothetical protein